MASATAGAVAASTLLGETTAFRLHINNSDHPSDYDDTYRTVTLHSDGTFTDYNEHLWDLSSAWVTEGVDRIVYGGTYTLNLPNKSCSTPRLSQRAKMCTWGKSLTR